MADPYDWLGLPKSHRPPTHYQLLGVPPSEATATLIEAAAEQQIQRVQANRSGSSSTACDILIREIEQARDTLLDPERRELYDLLTPDAPVERIVLTSSTHSNPVPAAVTAPEPEATSAAAAWWQSPLPPEEPVRPIPTVPVPPPEAPRIDTPEPVTHTEAQPWYLGGTTDLPVEIPKPVPPGMPSSIQPSTAWSEPLPSARSGGVTASPDWWKASDGPAKPEIPPPAVHVPVPVPAADDNGITDPTQIGRPLPVSSGSYATTIVAALVVIMGLIGGGLAIVYLKKDKPEEVVLEKKEDNSKPRESAPKVEEKKEEDPDKPPANPDFVAPISKDFLLAIPAKSLKGHAGTVTAVAISPNGKFIASGDSEKGVRVYSLRQDQSLSRQFLVGPCVGIGFVGSDGRLAVADGLSVHLADALQDGPRRKLETPGRASNSAMAVAPDGSVLVGQNDGSIRRFLRNGKSEEFSVAGEAKVTLLAVSEDGSKSLALIDKMCTIFDGKTGLRIHTLSPHKGAISAAALSPNGQRVFTAGDDGTTSIFDLGTKSTTARLQGHQGIVLAASWLKNGRWLVTCGTDEKVRLWDTETGRSLRWSQAVEGKGYSIAVAPKDAYVAVGTGRGILQIYPLPRVSFEEPQPIASVPKERLRLPEQTATGPILAALQAELKDDYALNQPVDRILLAEKLFLRGQAINRSPAERFALFREARNLAATGAALEDALRAVDQLDAWFDIDDLRSRSEAIRLLPAKCELRDTLPGLLRVLDRCEREVRPELIQDILKSPAFLEIMQSPTDIDPRLVAFVQRVKERDEELQVARMALEKWKANPKDAESNTTLGMYHSLSRHDWESGVPYLKLANIAEVSDAAKKDGARPKDGPGQLAVADAWYKLSSNAKEERIRLAYLLRAKTWYEMALKNKLEIKDIVRAQERIKSAELVSANQSKRQDLPQVRGVVPRKSYSTTQLGSLFNQEWKASLPIKESAEGISFPTGPLEVRSRFRFVDDCRIFVEWVPDGRQLRITLGVEEIVVPASDTRMAIEIQRTKDTLQWQIFRNGKGDEILSKMLPADRLRNTSVDIRLDGVPANPNGVLFPSLVISGNIIPASPLGD